MKQKAETYKKKRIVMGDENLVTNSEIHIKDVVKDLYGDISDGGDSDGNMPVIGDGKTYLYIKIPHKAFRYITIHFSQTVNDGVLINWGDGTKDAKYWITGDVSANHHYPDAGDYTISLEPIDGCTLELGSSTSSIPVIGSSSSDIQLYASMLQNIEIGRGVTRIKDYAFSGCYFLTNVVISDSVESIGKYAFRDCFSLSNIKIGNGVTRIGTYAFGYCRNLSSIVIPDSVTSIEDHVFNNCSKLSSLIIPKGITFISENTLYECTWLTSIVVLGNIGAIGNNAFSNCYGATSLDLSKCISVPTLRGTSTFKNSRNIKIIVPDALYDEWKVATNWASHASKIVKVSEFDA